MYIYKIFETSPIISDNSDVSINLLFAIGNCTSAWIIYEHILHNQPKMPALYSIRIVYVYSIHRLRIKFLYRQDKSFCKTVLYAYYIVLQRKIYCEFLCFIRNYTTQAYLFNLYIMLDP